MLIGLIVKNEAASIAETLQSLRELAPDARIRVFDSGSTDATPEIVLHSGYRLMPLPWHPSGRYDYSYNAMLEELERQAVDPLEWIFHAHGRRVYFGEWAPPHDASIVTATEHWSDQCHATRVIAYRARMRLRYEGATHEIIRRPPDMPVEDSGVRLRRHQCEHPRPERFERDLRLLENDASPRAAFYRAQTLGCLGHQALAAGDLPAAESWLQQAYCAYLVRADMQGQGDDQEVCVALTRVLQLVPKHEGMLRFATRCAHQALAISPDRPEPWLALAEFCDAVGKCDLARRYAHFAAVAEPDPRSLFLDPSAKARARELACNPAL